MLKSCEVRTCRYAKKTNTNKMIDQMITKTSPFGDFKLSKELSSFMRDFFGDGTCCTTGLIYPNKSGFGNDRTFLAMDMYDSFLPYCYYVETVEKADKEPELYHVFNIACAGYAKENIKVSKKENVLSVSFETPETKIASGKTTLDDGTAITRNVVHNGLSGKSGKISWMIKGLQHSEVPECRINNGVLTLRVKMKEPVDNSETIEIK